MKPLLACLDVFFTTQTELSKSKILLAQNFILKTVARLYLRSKAILVADPLVEMTGLEPVTPGLQSRCSPN